MKKPPKTGVPKARPTAVGPADKRKQNRCKLLRQLIGEAEADNKVTLDEKASKFYEASAGVFGAVREDHKTLVRSLKRKLAIDRHVEKHRLRAVQGDTAALEYLFHLARTAAYALEYSAQDHPRPVKNFAAQQVDWPVIMSPFPKIKTANMRYFASLKVGSNVASPVDPHALVKAPTVQTPARPWVVDLAMTVRQLQAFFVADIVLHRMLDISLDPASIEGSIPPGCSWSPGLIIDALNLEKLTKSEESQEAWQKFALKVAREEAGGELARHPRLKSIGNNRAKSKRGLVGECTVMNKRRVKTPESLARSAIKQAIRNSLSSLALLG